MWPLAWLLVAGRCPSSVVNVAAAARVGAMDRALARPVGFDMESTGSSRKDRSTKKATLHSRAIACLVTQPPSGRLCHALVYE